MFVVAEATWLPEPLSNFTDTPDIPGSPESWIPLALLSLNTKSPMDEQFTLAVITTAALEADVHPVLFLTVNVYVPAGSPLIVIEEVLPVVETFPGSLVSVQVPDGNPVNFTEPVETEQVGWVIVLIVGAAGITGCAFTTTFPVADDVQPSAFITVNV